MNGSNGVDDLINILFIDQHASEEWSFLSEGRKCSITDLKSEG